MPNIKSQIKRDATNKAANEKNSAAKSEARTAAKKVEPLVKEGHKEEAVKDLNEAISLFDRLAQKGVVAKNNADRKKAHLQRIVDELK